MHDALGAIRAAQRDRPLLALVVIAAADQFGAGPEIQLQGFDVGFEPVRQLVLRNIDGEGRRKRQIGQVIDVALRCAASANDSACASCRRCARAGRRSAYRRRADAAARRSTVRPGRRRRQSRPDRDRRRRASGRAGRSSSRRRNRACCRGGARLLNSSSWPRSSCRFVLRVQARNCDGACGSGTSRTTPLAGPNAVSKSNSTSIVSVPARVTQRGGVRFAREYENFSAAVRASVSRSIAAIAGRPAMVWMVQVKASTSRQRPSARNNSAAALASCACNAASKLSSQRCASAGAVACFLSATFIMRQQAALRVYRGRIVMAASCPAFSMPGIHRRAQPKDVDGRDKPGHDGE